MEMQLRLKDLEMRANVEPNSANLFPRCRNRLIHSDILAIKKSNGPVVLDQAIAARQSGTAPDGVWIVPQPTNMGHGERYELTRWGLGLKQRIL